MVTSKRKRQGKKAAKLKDLPAKAKRMDAAAVKGGIYMKYTGSISGDASAGGHEKWIEL